MAPKFGNAEVERGEMFSKGNLCSLLLGMQTSGATLEISSENTQKLKTNLTDHPTMLFLGICPKGIPSFSTYSCLATFIAALFTMANKSKQYKCSTSGNVLYIV